MKKLFLGCLILCLWSSLVHTQTFNARFSTAVYSWENQFVDTTSANSMRGYQSAAINLGDVFVPNLSIHTYARGWYDLSAKTGQNPDYQVYSLYARWHNNPEAMHRIDTRVGRQQILTGLRSPTVDAIRADYSYGDHVTVMGYFGSLAPLDGGAEALKPYQRRAFGGKVSTSKFFKTNASFTYYDKSRESASYYLENIISQDNLVRYPRIKERFMGFDLNRMFVKKINWFAHAEYNALEKQLQVVSSDIQYRPTSDWFAAVEFVSRKPNLVYKSFFTAFDDLKDNQEIWFRANYRIDHLWSVNGDFANVFYSGKDAQRLSLGVGFWRTSLTYMMRSGYGGTMNAVSCAATYPVTGTLSSYASVSYVMYKLDDFTITDPFSIAKDLTGETNTSFTAVGRLSYELLRSFHVDAEMQFLSQNIKTSTLYAGNKYDARFFLRANYWIFSKL
jgi:hypothetical protein